MHPFLLVYPENNILIPDIWQQEAIQALNAGSDVIVHAPTGAGKTLIFEQFINKNPALKAVYTVPTRALANDKMREFRSKGWDVGIATGDLHENVTAPIVVATLETQKGRLLRGKGPHLLVIDEYQMLNDEQRGIHYELAIAVAPAHTQLLLLSGSVANPSMAQAWLQRMGRTATLIAHHTRPVPQDEILMEGLRAHPPARLRQPDIRNIAKGLMAELGPILVFTPQRMASETLAKTLSSVLPIDDPLVLSPEQKRIAGKELGRMLKKRIAYHHSGLSYQQRAGLIEPLTKAGQLRVVIATTGLAAGINFSLRSVMVLQSTYRVQDRHLNLRPDELLQMFGRAGRRGLDDKGFVLSTQTGVRLREAQALPLTASNHLDWPTIIGVLRIAQEQGQEPENSCQKITERLLSPPHHSLGLAEFLSPAGQQELASLRTRSAPQQQRMITEMLNSQEQWERLPTIKKTQLGQTLKRHKNHWIPSLRDPSTLQNLPLGTLCLIQKKPKIYGIEALIAHFPKKEGQHKLRIHKKIQQSLQALPAQSDLPRWMRSKTLWTLEQLEQELLPRLGLLFAGGQAQAYFTRQNGLYTHIDFQEVPIAARLDSCEQYLLSPPTREVPAQEIANFASLFADQSSSDSQRSPCQYWYQLGLINEQAQPTQRGILFSFFQAGEGLAIAAGLEAESLPAEELLWQLANIRAGYRFDLMGASDNRLSTLCRVLYQGLSIPGYLKQGLPPEYGDGASEALQAYLEHKQEHQQGEQSYSTGDMERILVEWKSLLNHIVQAPPLDWPKWTRLQELCQQWIDKVPPTHTQDLPALTLAQRSPYQGRLRFN